MRSAALSRPLHHDGRTLVFLHVPKTAGTTLGWIIRRQYPQSRTMDIQPDHMVDKYRKFLALPEPARRGLRCLTGHIPYGMHRWLPQGARYVTMLRHPVDWTVSLHAFIQRMTFFDQDPDLAGFRSGRGLTLDAFVSFLADAHLADMQTRLIAGQVGFETLLPPYAPLTSDALDVAKRNLTEQCECVGIIERFDESLLLMQRRFNWRNVHYRPLNTGEGAGKETTLSPALRDRILAINSRDVALYDAARRRVESDIALLGEDFQRQLRRFRRRNALYVRLMPLYEASGLSRVRGFLRRTLETAR
jgi:hypothetical protein